MMTKKVKYRTKKRNKEKLESFPKDTISGYILDFFEANRINSMKEYLLSLDHHNPEWKVPEDELLICRYFNHIYTGNNWHKEIEDSWSNENPDLSEEQVALDAQEYIRYVSSLPFVSVALRTFYPGSEIKETLLLQGEQGAGKSEMFRRIMPQALRESRFRPSFNEKMDSDKKFERLRSASLVEFTDAIYTHSAKDVAEVKQDRRKFQHTVRRPYDREESTWRITFAAVRTCNSMLGVVGNDDSGTDDTLFLKTLTKWDKKKYRYFDEGDNRTRLWIGAVRLMNKVVAEDFGDSDTVTLVVPSKVKKMGEVIIEPYLMDTSKELGDEIRVANELDGDIRKLFREVQIYKYKRDTSKYAILFEDVFKFYYKSIYEQLVYKSYDGKLNMRDGEVKRFKKALMKTSAVLDRAKYKKTRIPIVVYSIEMLMERNMDIKEIRQNAIPISDIGNETFDAIDGDAEAPKKEDDDIDLIND